MILLNNYIKGQGNKKAPITEKKFEEILININDKNFFHSIGFDKWLFKVFIKNYYEIFINLYFRFNDASKSLNKLLTFGLLKVNFSYSKQATHQSA